jgi:hypothetical protein
VIWLLSSFIGAAQIIVGGVANDEEETLVLEDMIDFPTLPYLAGDIIQHRLESKSNSFKPFPDQPAISA